MFLYGKEHAQVNLFYQFNVCVCSVINGLKQTKHTYKWCTVLLCNLTDCLSVHTRKWRLPSIWPPEQDTVKLHSSCCRTQHKWMPRRRYELCSFA